MEFKEELDELEKAYTDNIAALKESMDNITHSMVRYMRGFVEGYDKLQGLETKLDVLQSKRGKNGSGET